MTTRAAHYEWTFSQGTLDAALGTGLLEFRDAESQAASSFGLSDGAAIPDIGGLTASFLRVPAFASGANGLLLTLSDTGPNGGGSYVNQYTVGFDILSPGSINWTPFFNSDVANNNDADFYIAPEGSVGIGLYGYSAPGAITADTWHRVIMTADLGVGTVTYYVDGMQAHQNTLGGQLDGRLSLYSNADAGPDVLLFNEGDSSGTYTHELLVNGLFVSDTVLNAAQIFALGGASSAGFLVPEPSTTTMLVVGAVLMLLWQCRRRRHV